jgi:hypothetical protein
MKCRRWTPYVPSFDCWLHALLFFICFDRLTVLLLDFITSALICTGFLIYFKLVIVSRVQIPKKDTVDETSSTTPRLCSDNELYFISLLVDHPPDPIWLCWDSVWWRELTSKWFLQLKDSFYLAVHQMHWSIAVIINNRGHNKDHKAQSTNTLQSNNEHASLGSVKDQPGSYHIN